MFETFLILEIIQKMFNNYTEISSIANKLLGSSMKVLISKS